MQLINGIPSYIQAQRSKWKKKKKDMTHFMVFGSGDIRSMEINTDEEHGTLKIKDGGKKREREKKEEENRSRNEAERRSQPEEIDYIPSFKVSFIRKKTKDRTGRTKSFQPYTTKLCSERCRLGLLLYKKAVGCSWCTRRRSSPRYLWPRHV